MMEHKDFQIGQEFWSAERLYRCTDVGTRTIVAIRIDQVKVAGTSPELHRTLDRKTAEVDGWFNGPPYPVPETVFDEDDMPICTPNNRIEKPSPL